MPFKMIGGEQTLRDSQNAIDHDWVKLNITMLPKQTTGSKSVSHLDQIAKPEKHNTRKTCYLGRRVGRGKALG